MVVTVRPTNSSVGLYSIWHISKYIASWQACRQRPRHSEISCKGSWLESRSFFLAVSDRVYLILELHWEWFFILTDPWEDLSKPVLLQTWIQVISFLPSLVYFLRDVAACYYCYHFYCLLIKCVYSQPGPVPTTSCNFSLNPLKSPEGSIILNLFYRWGSWGFRGFGSKEESEDSSLPSCKALAHDHLISYYLIFFLSWANCLLTSVCFTVYFPWLQTMASFLMHANSVTNLVRFFVSWKYIYNPALCVQPLLAISSHLSSLPLPLPPWCPFHPCGPLQALQHIVTDSSSDTSCIRLCPCLSFLQRNRILTALQKNIDCLHQLKPTPSHRCFSAFTHAVPGVWSFELWPSMQLPFVRYKGGKSELFKKEW